MAKDPAFLFYVQDFIMGTMLMSHEEVGIYIRLLCVQHQHKGYVEKESFNAMVGDKVRIRAKFKESKKGFYNDRLLDEINKRTNKSHKLSANAVKRWDKCKSNAIALQKDMPIEDIDAIALHAAILTDTSTPDALDVLVLKKGMVLNFEDIWSKYPSRVGKKASERHFRASVKTEKDLDDIHTALNNYMESERVKVGKIQNGSTWFNNWRDWIDYKDPVSPQKQQDELLRKAGLTHDSTSSRGAYLREECQR